MLAALAPAPDYLVEVIAPQGGGSGILIAPGLVLCCAHEIPGRVRNVQVRGAGADLPATVIHRELDLPKLRDLALIRLERPIPHQALEWLPTLFNGVEIDLRGHWQGAIVTARTKTICVRYREPESRVLAFDVEPAALAGMSGGAALVTIGDRRFCVGIVRKGGEDAFKSIVIGEGEVSRFLAGHAKLPLFPPDTPAPANPPDTAIYFKRLQEDCGYIVPVGQAKAGRVPIARVFIPLRTPNHRSGQRDQPLLQTLAQTRNALITGAAGSGKTTFVRRLALALAPNQPADPKFRVPFRAFPVYIRISKLEEHIAKLGAPYTDFADPRWIAHYLAAQPNALDQTFFEAKLNHPDTLLLLDGLDEASNETRRAEIARLLRHAVLLFRCRFVATTRPEAFQKDVHLPDFAHLPIEDLNDAEIAAFLRDWYRGLHEDDESAADRAARELVEAIGRARPDILRLARNPLMLTLLAVVHWNRGRLPEGRADLYRAVLEHLAEWAKDGDHPCPPKVRLRRLSLLAFAMQAGKGGQTLQLDLGAAASHIHSTFASDRPRDDALEFLGREQAASGILTLHQGQVRFWHRSFQEFLAAWRLAGAADKDLPQVKTFLYVPEWRESIQLLTGLWYPDQHDRLDSLLAMLVEHAAGKNTLPRKACAAGILGAVLADLAPGGYRLPAEAQTSYRKLLDEVMAIFRPGAHALIGLRDRAAAADALALAHDPRLLTPHDPDYWIPVPSGIAVIGEGPDERRVPIERGFRIGRFPVTVDEYRKYREDPRHSSPPPQPDDWEEQLRHPSRPVVFITWEAADRYCKHFGCQLPSEVQWEYAARGEEGRPYPWGEAPPGQSRAIFDQALEHAAPVGLCPEGATPLGVTDMAGSCWEWTATEWASGHHVVKGGSWYNNAAGMRCSYRDGGHDVVDGSDNGFRCVREGLP